MRLSIPFIFSLILLLFSCHKSLEDGSNDINIIAETSVKNQISRSITNWIPGNLFIDGTDNVDYIVFPQKGSISLDYTSITNTMIPEEYKDYTGLAPDRSFEVLIPLDKNSITCNRTNYIVNGKNYKTKVSFISTHGCLIDENAVPAIISTSGKLEAKDTSNNIIALNGEIEINVEIQSTRQVINFKFTELYANANER